MSHSFDKSSSGAKKIRIKAEDASINSPFEFNKSITPHGGTEASMSVSLSKKGKIRVKIFQDLNDDGIASKNELIYKGKSPRMLYRDELLNFSGDIKITKSMHQCEWITAKYPDEMIMCTREYIPTIYDVVMTTSSGKRFVMDGVGEFQPPPSFLP